MDSFYGPMEKRKSKCRKLNGSDEKQQEIEIANSIPQGILPINL
jgi:hypothetical protein